MLPRPGFSDDPGFLHPHSQEHLADRVINFMRAGMTEIFPLQIDPGPAKLLGQPGRMIERRRSPDILFEIVGQFLPEPAIFPSRCILLLQFEQRRHQRFRHIAAAVGAESSVAVGDLLHRAVQSFQMMTEYNRAPQAETSLAA